MSTNTKTPGTPAPIAIIGGGPCGLIFARLLEVAGIPYIVFERDLSPTNTHHHGRHDQGGTLDVHHETGQAALRAAGLIDEFEKLARRDAAVMTIQDFRGENFFRIGDINARTDGDDGGEGEGKKIMNDRPEIDRLQLRGLLLSSIPAERIRWGKTLLCVERRRQEKEREGEGEGDVGEGAGDWVLRFADGTSETGFRLIVGADGAWSKVRSLITPAKPIYAGKTIIEGRLSLTNPQYASAVQLVGPGNSVATGSGVALTVQQMSDRTYRVYTFVTAPENSTRSGGALDLSDVEKTRTTLLADKAFFADWSPNLRAFIENAEGPWRAWPLYYLDPEIFLPEAEGKTKEKEGGQAAGWKRTPGVVLLGDAGHVGLPNGEGVNLAMLDALELFKCLATELDIASGTEKSGGEKKREDDAARIERAIIAYEAGMGARAHEHIKDGIMVTDMMCQVDGAKRMADMFKQFMEKAGES